MALIRKCLKAQRFFTAALLVRGVFHLLFYMINGRIVCYVSTDLYGKSEKRQKVRERERVRDRVALKFDTSLHSISQNFTWGSVCVCGCAWMRACDRSHPIRIGYSDSLIDFSNKIQ